MTTTSVFSFQRFLALLKRYFLHSYKTLALALLVGFGISFMVIAFLQFTNVKNQSHNSMFLVIGVFGFALLGSFYISSAFSSFRTKEKAQAYLMLPATTLEKFLVEFIYYPLVFLILFPILYFAAYDLSTSFIAMIRTDFIPFNLKEEFLKVVTTQGHYFENGVEKTKQLNLWILWVAASFSIAMAFFLGATAFKKQVMLKTLLGLVIYFGFCAWLFYYLMVVLDWGKYWVSSEVSYLTPLGAGSNIQVIIPFFSCWMLCWGLLFSVVSFFKLKEKEV